MSDTDQGLLQDIEDTIKQGKAQYYASAFGSISALHVRAQIGPDKYSKSGLPELVEEINNQDPYHVNLIKYGHEFLKEYAPEVINDADKSAEKDFLFENSTMQVRDHEKEKKLRANDSLLSNFMQFKTEKVPNHPDVVDKDLRRTSAIKYDKTAPWASTGIAAIPAFVTGVMYMAGAPVAAPLKATVITALCAYSLAKVITTYCKKKLGVTKEDRHRLKDQDIDYSSNSSGNLLHQKQVYDKNAEVLDLFRKNDYPTFMKKAADDFGIIETAQTLLSNAVAGQKKNTHTIG